MDDMTHIVSITSQGQLTIPKKVLRALGVKGPVKAELVQKGKGFEVKPQKSFWELEGSLYNGMVATDEKLREARDAFEREWPRKM
jgi:bifunctional DNA-binding transcriptional regulator/antitoxin component of YhaV-PrlF toxin-antitoxin module